MKLILSLISFLTIQASGIKRDTCDGVPVKGVCHKQEILYENLVQPYLLNLDLRSNVLYFSHVVPTTRHKLKTARLDLDTKELKDIEGIRGGCAQVVDRYSHDVYIGGNDGLYKYDAVDDKATFIGAQGANIWAVYYYKDVLYYSLFPTQAITPHCTLYTFENGVSKKFPGLEDTKVKHFLIDNEFIYFSNNTGLYRQKKGTKDAILYNSPNPFVRGIAVNTKGIVHICLEDGIYVVNNGSLTVEKIVHIKDAFGLAFDENNKIIYSDATKIVRLLPTEIICTCRCS